MNQELQPGNGDPYEARSEDASLEIESFVHTRTRTLNTKLAVLALEIRERLQIRAGNIDRINQDKAQASEMLASLERSARYLMREHRDKAPVYEQLFRLEQERRAQDVECWRDVVMVMRDFLYAWEAHEQAKAKAMLLNV